MKKIILLILIGLIKFINAQQQSSAENKLIGNINKMFLPPPTANSLMKFEEVPVSYYTGIPDISIPLFNIPTNNKDLNLDIQLKYHPLSAKPKDKSGEQGLGWSLIAGGTITRTVRGGSPDEKDINKSITSPKIKYGIYNENYNPTYLIINNNASGLDTAEYAFNAALGRYDTEYDLYQYNFMGYAGRFYVVKQGSNMIVEKLDKNNLKITCNRNNTTREISDFTITDDKGIKYIFNIIEKSAKNTTNIKVGLHNQTQSVSPDFELGNYPTSYFLGKVNSPDNENLILFSYDLSTNLNYEESNTLTRRSAYNVFYNDDDPILNFNVDTSIPGSLESSTTYNESQSKLLTSITILDKAKITLTYEQGREDSNYINSASLYKLKSIQSVLLGTSNNDIIKKFLFNYKYSPQIEFYPLDGPSKQLKKLLLDKVVETYINTQNLEYEFDYYDYVQLSPIKENKWGYFEGLPILNNVIKSIKYPTKGKVEFNFEENDYSAYSTVNGIQGDISANMASVTGHYYNFPMEHSLGFSNFPRPNREFFTISVPQIVRITCYYGNLVYYPWRLSISKKVGTNLYDTVYYYDEFQQLPISPGGVISNPYPPGSATITEKDLYIQLDPGTYHMSLMNTGTYSTPLDLYSTFVAHTAEPSYVDQKIKKGGGIRIKDILYYDDINSSNPAKKKSFTYRNIENSLLSSGALVFPEPLYFYSDYYNLLYTRENQFGMVHQTVQYNAELLATTNYNILPSEKTHGADVGYQYVTVEDVDLSNNKKGRTVYKFRSPIDFPNQASLYTNMPIVPIANQDYLRGQLISKKTYDSDNKILSEIETQYSLEEYEKNDGIKIKDNFYNNMITKNYKYDSYQEFATHIGANVVLTSPYKNFEKFGVTLPIQSTEKSFFYKNGIQSIISKTTGNVYNSRDYLTSTTENLPDGSVNSSAMQYAHEKGNTRLINAHMIGFPLETTVVQKQSSTDVGKLISKTETKYDNPANLFPSSVLSYDLQNPTLTSTEVTYDQYDIKGNLLQYTTRDGIPTTIIWGYNSTQPIAKIVGHPYSLVNGLATEIVAASDADISSSTEQTLIDKLDDFRNLLQLKEFQITTYTYDPLIGVTSITPPSGIREVYSYDSANRLKEIKQQEKDATGNVIYKTVKEFKYNYKH
jgi:hypothetical protein